MRTQSSADRIRKNPICKAVNGCKDRALILSWRGKPICARHYGRWQRTGLLGKAGHKFGRGPTERAGLNDRANQNLERIRKVFGKETFYVVGHKPGMYVLFSKTRSVAPVFAIPAFNALVRRSLLATERTAMGQRIAWIP